MAASSPRFRLPPPGFAHSKGVPRKPVAQAWCTRGLPCSSPFAGLGTLCTRSAGEYISDQGAGGSRGWWGSQKLTQPKNGPSTLSSHFVARSPIQVVEWSSSGSALFHVWIEGSPCLAASGGQVERQVDAGADGAAARRVRAGPDARP